MNNQKLVELNSNFILDLKKLGIELSDRAVCYVRQSMVTIAILEDGPQVDGSYRIVFASEIEFYAKDEKYDWFKRDNEINFCSSGSFDPSNKGSYYRTIHAASILKNWDACCDLVNNYCAKFQDL